MNKPRILLGVPFYKTIYGRTAFCITDLVKNDNYDIQVLFQEGVFVHENQNNIVEYALLNKMDYVFFVEHDMVFESQTLEKLLKDDKDIICANYNYRSKPRYSMVFDLNEKKELAHFGELPKETFKCAAIPTGLTLIKTSVFEKLKRPYFFYKYNADGLMETSQDVYFCQKAREAGFEIYCNPTIEVGHIGEEIY